ncbi:MAG: molybdopterin-guanine dinucleotide biosynthesis protein B [Candidatus Caldarchaeum sp.]
MKFIAVFGTKNSGKTTLVEYFVERFVRDGYKVAAVKHIHHHFTIDTENKDTWRMARKGAKVVASVSPNELALMFHSVENRWENSLEKLFKILNDEGLDLVVFEGFHMVLGGRPDVYKLITVKNSGDVAIFLQTLKPPILAIVNNSGEPVPQTTIPVYTPPLSEELYLYTRKAIQISA